MNNTINIVYTKAKKCPNDECVAYGACGHHGPDGSCLVDGSEHPVLVKHAYAGMQQDVDDLE